MALHWYLDMSSDRKQEAPLRNRATMAMGRRPSLISGTRRQGVSDRPEKN